MSTESASGTSSQPSLFVLVKQILILAGFGGSGISYTKTRCACLGRYFRYVLLLLCLFFKIIKMDQVAMGATVVLGELLLFLCL